MSLLGLVAYMTLFFGGGQTGVPSNAPCPFPLHADMAVRGLLHDSMSHCMRPQANDSDDGNNDGSSIDDLTASLDDDHHHATALVWERLIVAATAILVAGNQPTLPVRATFHGLECGENLGLPSTSLRSLQICLQI